MPKKRKGGGRRPDNGRAQSKRELVTADKSGDQLYARVTKVLGGKQFACDCSDGDRRRCHVRGSMRKKEWVRVGDLVLFSPRLGSSNQGDIVYKYAVEEARELARCGEVPAHLVAEATVGGDDAEGDLTIGFDEAASGSEDGDGGDWDDLELDLV